MFKRLAENKTWLLLIGIIIVLIAVSFLNQRHQPEQYPLYVSHSPSPTGTKALYTYLAEEEIKTRQWKHDPSLLKSEDNTLLLMIEPAFMLSDKEVYYYEQFLNNGNTLILFSQDPADFFQIKTGFSGNIKDEDVFIYNDESYDLSVDTFTELIVAEDEEVLLSNSSGAFGMKRSYGDGQLIVIKSASIVSNDQITDEEHAEFITTLLYDTITDNQVVLFDEYVHEVQLMGLFINAYPFWFLVILFQMALLAIVWLFYKGKRFGPIYTPREDTVRFSDEGVVALASWYMRGKRYQDSLRIQADYLKQLLYDRWYIPYRLSWEDSASILYKKWQKPRGEINQFIKQLEAVLMQESISKSEYVKWSKLLDDLRKEVETR